MIGKIRVFDICRGSSGSGCHYQLWTHPDIVSPVECRQPAKSPYRKRQKKERECNAFQAIIDLQVSKKYTQEEKNANEIEIPFDFSRYKTFLD